MTIFLHVTLLVFSFFTFWYVIRKIRKSQFQIEDSVFWICFFLFVLVLGIIPPVGAFFSRLVGFDSPANFVFLSIIFVLLIKVFFQSIQISQLDSKIRSLSQKIALDKITTDTEVEAKAQLDES